MGRVSSIHFVGSLSLDITHKKLPIQPVHDNVNTKSSSSFTVPSGVMISHPCRTSYQSSPSSAIPCFPRDSLCAFRRPFCDVTAV